MYDSTACVFQGIGAQSQKQAGLAMADDSDIEFENILARRRADNARDSRRRRLIAGSVVALAVVAFLVFVGKAASGPSEDASPTIEYGGKKYYDRGGYLVDRDGNYLMTRRRGYWDKVRSPQGEAEDGAAILEGFNKAADRGLEASRDGLEIQRRQNEEDNARAKRNRSAGSRNLP